MIAFAGIRSRIAAAAGAIFSEGRVASASAILTRAQGGASPAKFTRPMSHRRENTQQREFTQPRGTGTHADCHQPCNALDLSVWGETGHHETPSSCTVAELRRCGTRKGLPGSVVEQPAAADAELVDGHGLLASLVWHRVRPPNQSAAVTGTRGPSRTDLESLGKRRSAPPVTTAKTVSLDQSPASIEALFSHLAHRRLRSFAAKEKQA